MSQAEARRELMRAGIEPVLGDDRTKRYCPDLVEKLAQELAEQEADEQPTERGETMRKRGAEADTIAQMAAFIRIQGDMVKQLHETVIDLVKASPVMLEKAQAILVAASQRDAEAIARFYEQREEMFRLREEALSEKADRELMREQVLADERRKDIAFTALKDSAPRLLNQIVATIGARTADPKVLAAVSLLQSVDDASLCMLLDEGVGVLNAEQREQLRKVLGDEKVKQLDELKKKEGLP